MKTQYMMRDEMDVRPDVALYYKLHKSPMINATGSETITNGDFSSGDTGWTVGANWDTSSGKAVHSTGNTATLVNTGTAPLAGQSYRVQFTISSRTVGTVDVALGSVSTGMRNLATNQAYTFFIIVTDATKLTVSPSSNFDGSIDDVSVIPYARNVFDYSLGGNTGLMVDTASTMVLLPKYPGFDFDGSANFIDVGNHGGAIKTIAMWLKATSVGGFDYPIDLNGTDYIIINAGSVGVNGFAGSTLYVDGVQASTITAGKWHLIGLTIATAKTASDLDIGRVEGVGLFTGLIGETILSVNELAELDVMNLYQTSRRRYDGK